MRESWPHAQPHHFTIHETYLITAATLHRKRLFDSGAKLDLLRDTTFELAKKLSAPFAGVGLLYESLPHRYELRKHGDDAS
jgi:hypothetical protein